MKYMLLFLIVLSIGTINATQVALLFNDKPLLFSNNHTFLYNLKNNFKLQSSIIESGTYNEFFKNYGEYYLQFPNLIYAQEALLWSLDPPCLNTGTMNNIYTAYYCSSN